MNSDSGSSTSGQSRGVVCEKPRESGKKHETWRGAADFFLSCVGAAVGLGNIWRFPYLCYKNGGGSFLIPYVIVLVCAGVPVFFLEIALGQYTSKGGIGAWDICPIFRGVGYGCTIIIMLCDIYYIVLLAWAILYMYFSFSFVLPWSHCDNWWNTESCMDNFDGVGKLNASKISNGSSSANQSAFYNSSLTTAVLPVSTEAASVVDSVTEFWERRLLQISQGIDEPGGLVWELVLALAVAWLLVYFCVWKGVKVAGKVVYFTAVFPYVVLTVLLIRGVTLEGAKDGLVFYLKPDFTKLVEPQVWIDAGTQVFYSYVLGVNMLIALGSYNKFNNNCYKDCIALVCVNSCTSFYAGFAVFSVLGFMANQQGVSVADVAESGPGLVFIAYPKAITQMPFAPFWAILFFFMIILVGLDSEFVGVEAVMRVATDMYPCLIKGFRRELLTAVYVTVLFLVGLSMVTRGGMYVFQLFDYYSCSGMALMWACLFETIAVAWVYGADRFYDNIAQMIGYRINPWLKICWCLITPVLLIGMFLWYCVKFTVLKYNRVYVYPSWAQGGGMCLAFSSMICVPTYFVYKLVTSPGATPLQKWRYATTPVISPVRIPSHWPDFEQLKAHTHRERSRQTGGLFCACVSTVESDNPAPSPEEELLSLKT